VLIALNSDLRFPSVTDASDVDAAQSAFVSSENSVFAAQVHMQILRVRDDPLEIISGILRSARDWEILNCRLVSQHYNSILYAKVEKTFF
jgi:hypothetical protein